jgi:hypothetical protein
MTSRIDQDSPESMSIGPNLEKTHQSQLVAADSIDLFETYRVPKNFCDEAGSAFR